MGEELRRVDLAGRVARLDLDVVLLLVDQDVDAVDLELLGVLHGGLAFAIAVDRLDGLDDDLPTLLPAEVFERQVGLLYGVGGKHVGVVADARVSPRPLAEGRHGRGEQRQGG